MSEVLFSQEDEPINMMSLYRSSAISCPFCDHSHPGVDTDNLKDVTFHFPCAAEELSRPDSLRREAALALLRTCPYCMPMKADYGLKTVVTGEIYR